MARSSTTWKKGQSGNRAGRKPEPWSISHIVRKVLAEVVATRDGKNMTFREAIVRRAVKAALGGDRHAREFLASYDQSRPPTATERMVIEGELSPDQVKIIMTPLLGPLPCKNGSEEAGEQTSCEMDTRDAEDDRPDY